ncbi:MAG: prepilin-type N-terminal cleavage/methylation domain-containing protein [Armatimonadetes bacterium]|nr:prepilin-type N-terminal cleavage/methylation domain-containing protein [Armatimonadota bacterium]
MKRPRNTKKGFTLVEIMIVVLIIGILLAIAVPNFVRARERARAKTCVGNLKQLDSAKEQWAMENRADDGAAVDMTDLVPTYVKAEPACPSGGTYDTTTIGEDPTCSTGGEHAIGAN